MLFKNGVKIDLRDESPEAQEFRDFVKNTKFPVKLVINPRYVAKQRMIDSSGNPTEIRTAPGQYMMYVETVTNEEGLSDVWAYSKVAPIERNGRMRYGQEGEWWNDVKTKSIDKNDSELAFFLCTKSRLITKLKVWQVEDKAADAKKLVASKSKKAYLEYYLYSPDSIFNVDENGVEKLKTICKSWGIANVDSLTKDEMIVQLETLIIAGENSGGMGIDDFMKATKLDSATKFRALIQTAEDQEVIYFDLLKATWNFKSSNGKGEVIIKLSPNELAKKEDVLANYLTVHTEVLEAIERILNGGELEVDYTKKPLTKEEIDEMVDKKFNDAKKIISMNGGKVGGRSKQEIAVALYEYYGIE